MSQFVNILRKKWFKVGVVIFVVFYLAALTFIYWAMRQPPEEFGRVMSKLPAPVVFLAFPFEALWMKARAGALKVGDPAPDFSLSRQDKTGAVQLATLTAQQPVVLVFGSYT
ncbi:MAG: hypothetical protein DMG90_04915 [Acidobacteria bacterium]|jgi:hypothetical protein|nr:MAG: hypothetical protein DMG91_14635 [Acidobacteriota bacterium]PYV92250.1 MAG: hypothetical protein DMG90_04915 [Acidobacteriota bacterium]